MTFETHERGPMCISTDPTSGLSVAQRRVLQAFYAGRLTAGNLMEELRRAAAAVPSNPPQASVSEAPPLVVAEHPSGVARSSSWSSNGCDV
jgi:hypothetical protein